MRRRRAAYWATCGLFAASAHANEAPNTAYAAGTISQPGIEDASTNAGSTVQVNQGRAAITVPIAVPPGKPGLAPQLSLTYSGGRQDGVAGAGWRIGPGAIRAKVHGRGGQPDYDSGAVTWLGLSGEALIEVDTLADSADDADSDAETVFREERDLSYLRYVQLSGGGWRVDMPDGRQMLFGTHADARISRTGGTDSTYDSWISAWLLESTRDRSGQVVEYTWANADVADDGASNASATNDVARYLTDIKYGCQTSCGDTYQHIQLGYAHRETAGYANVLSFAAGFLVETELYLSTIDTASVVDATSDGARTYTLGYDSAETRRMLLTSFATVGADGTSLPTQHFTWTDGDAPSDPESTVDASDQPDETFGSGVFPMDFDLDGRIDIVDLSSGGSDWYRSNGLGALGYDSAASITDPPDASGKPSSANVGLLDLDRSLGLDTHDRKNYVEDTEDIDGDGATDERIYPLYQHASGTGWSQTFTTFSGTYDDTVRQMDVDRDGFVDIVKTCSTGDSGCTGWAVLLNDQTHDFDDTQIACSQSPSDDADTPGMVFGDINADGLVDAVYLASDTTARIYYGRGRHDCFGFTADDNHGSTVYAEYTITNGSHAASRADARLVDMNGDGFADLVSIGTTRVGVWLFNPTTGFDAVDAWSQLSTSGSKECRVADFDADGANEILCSYDWTLYDFADGPTHALQTVTNGYGATTTLEYTTSSRVAAAHEDASDAWTTNIASTIKVISAQEVDDGRGQILRTEYDYRDAYYHTDAENDRFEFVGFGFVEQTALPYLELPGSSRILDPMDPGLITRSFFDVGDSDWNLRGRAGCVERWSGDASPTGFACNGSGPIDRVESTWAATTDGDGITSVLLDRVDRTILEGGASGETIRTDFTYDVYGNVTLALNWGRYDAGDAVHGDDESAVATDYTNDASEWLLRLPSRIRTGGIASGAIDVLSVEHRLYDGNPTWSAQTLTNGQLTERQVWTWDSITGGAGTTDTVEERTYTIEGMTDTRIAADGSVIDLNYDADFGLFLHEEIVDPTGLALTTESAVDPATGKTLWVRDPAGGLTGALYDDLGRITHLMKPGDTPASPTYSMHYAEDASAATRSVTTVAKDGSADGLTTVEMQDALGRALCKTREAISGVDVVERIEWTATGRPSVLLLPLNDTGCPDIPLSAATPSGRDTSLNRWIRTYDALGRPIDRVHLPTQATESWGYDVLSVTIADAEDNQAGGAHAATTTVHSHDGQGRRVSVTETLGADTLDTTYRYDARGLLTEVTDPKSNLVFEAAYDSRGRMVWAKDADRGERSISYDDMDRPSQQIDARNESIDFTYDLAGRITERTTSDGTIEWHYDTARLTGACATSGRLAGVTHLQGSIDFCYDTRGRVKRSETQFDSYANTLVVEQGYDALDRLRTRTYPDDTVAIYQYAQPHGRLSNISVDGDDGHVQSMAYWIEYRPDGSPLKYSLANGARAFFAYDSRDRFKRLRVAHSGADIFDERIVLDRVSNIVSIVDQVGDGDADFDYDDLYRLTEASGLRYDGETASYAYDTLGNLTSKTFTDTTSDLHVGTLTHRTDLVHAVDTAMGSTFNYDAAGNLTDDGVFAFAYTAHGQLAEVDDGGLTTLVTNGYDHNDLRVERVTDDAVVYYLPHADAELRVPNGASATLLKTIRFAGKRIARVADTFDSTTVADQVSVHVTDHLNQSALVMDMGGGTAERWYGHPFGEENSDAAGSDYLAPDDANTGLFQRFQGREIDATTGLYDFGARVYSPILGRFLSPDDRVPYLARSQSFNRYAFVQNNPLSRIDPDGHADNCVVSGDQTACGPSNTEYLIGNEDSVYAATIGAGANRRNHDMSGEGVGMHDYTFAGLDFGHHLKLGTVYERHASLGLSALTAEGGLQLFMGDQVGTEHRIGMVGAANASVANLNLTRGTKFLNTFSVEVTGGVGLKGVGAKKGFYVGYDTESFELSANLFGGGNIRWGLSLAEDSILPEKLTQWARAALHETFTIDSPATPSGHVEGVHP